MHGLPVGFEDEVLGCNHADRPTGPHSDGRLNIEIAIDDALANTLRAELDPSPVSGQEAGEVLTDGGGCSFNRSPETDPILRIAAGGGEAVMKLNGVIVPLAGSETENGASTYQAPGVTMTVRSLGDNADWRSDAELVFALDGGPTVGYRGFYSCGD